MGWEAHFPAEPHIHSVPRRLHVQGGSSWLPPPPPGRAPQREAPQVGRALSGFLNPAEKSAGPLTRGPDSWIWSWEVTVGFQRHKVLLPLVLCSAQWVCTSPSSCPWLASGHPSRPAGGWSLSLRTFPQRHLGPCVRGFASSVSVGSSWVLEVELGWRMPGTSVFWGTAQLASSSRGIWVHTPG